MTRFRIKNLKILSSCLSLWVVLFGGALHLALGSEFPERECCDLTTTSTVGPLPMPPAALPTDKSLSSATTALETDLAIGRSGKWSLGNLKFIKKKRTIQIGRLTEALEKVS